MEPQRPIDDVAAPMRKRRRVLLAVLFVVAVVIDWGIWLSEAICENCGGHPGSGQKLSFAISGGIAALVGAALRWRRRKAAATGVLMIAAILLLRWLLIAAQ